MSRKSLRVVVILFLGSLVWLIAGCAPAQVPVSQSAAVPAGVEVSGVSEANTVTTEITQKKAFNQCESAGPFKAEIQFGDSNSQSTQQELVLKVTAGGEVGLSPVAKVKLEGAIEQHFAAANAQSQNHTESAAIEVPAHTQQEYIITWLETRREGTVNYTENGVAKSSGFSYRTGLELASTQVKDLPCPGQASSPAAGSQPVVNPTPDPHAELLRLIDTERQAVLTRDLKLLTTIYASGATKTNAATGVSAPAMSEYSRTFNNELYQWITHTNFQVDLSADMAIVTNDSCGQFHLKNENKDLSFNCPQCDRWTFQREAGRWWITDFTYSLPATAPQYRYSFEDGTNGCWVARIDNNVPQGSDPSFTQEGAHQGQGALRLPLDLTASVPRSQIVRLNMPFSGQAEAYVYAPPDAPADLAAGFFAMDFDHDPWNYHAADQMIPLKPGAWTPVTWNVNTTGWARPLQLLGLEVRRANNEPYQGYVLIDEVSIHSQ